jgi:hypothetical protein
VLDILLSESEEAQCREWGLAINANKERLGKGRRGSGNRYEGIDADVSRINAIRSEYAVAKALGVLYDCEILPGGDGGVDVTLPVPCRFGKTVQVKWRSERERDLATETSGNLARDLRADIYILTWPGAVDRYITLVGFATMDDWRKRVFSRPAVWMRGEKWELRWKTELRPMQTLVEAVRKVQAA